MLANTYDMLQLLRDYVGEAVASHWSELNLQRRLNAASKELARIVANSSGQWLVKSASVTATAGVITLPNDCSKPIFLEDSNGNAVSWLNSVAQRRVSRVTGAGTSSIGLREAYPLMKTLEVNEENFSDTLTLWYQQRVVDLHAGTASAGGAGSLTFEASARANQQDDHYNNAQIEVVSGTGPGIYTITDYTGSTGACTLSSGTCGTDSVYGIIPTTPPECNDFIVLRAAVLAIIRPSSTLDEKVAQFLMSEYRRVRSDIADWLETRIIENTGVTIGEAYI